MARFTPVFTLLSLFATSQTYAGTRCAPLSSSDTKHSCLLSTVPVTELAARQVGDLQCNIDRFTIVGALAAMQGTLTALSVKTAK